MTILRLVLGRRLFIVLTFRLVRLTYVIKRRSHCRYSITNLVPMLRTGAASHRRSTNELVFANLPRAVLHAGRCCSKWIWGSQNPKFLRSQGQYVMCIEYNNDTAYLLTFLANHFSREGSYRVAMSTESGIITYQAQSGFEEL